jgi:signal transduction histidine kinase
MLTVVAISGWIVALLSVLTALALSRRKHAALARSKDAEQLAFIGSLAAGLAHEMKNPLSTVNLNLQLLKEDFQRPETLREEETYCKLTTMLRETARLEQSINNFLRFAGGQGFELAAQNLNSFVSSLLDGIRAEAEHAGVRIALLLAQGLPLVGFDQGLLRQAFHNLLVNAIQAMPQGGVLTVQTRAVAGARHVKIDFTDSGEGMTSETLEKVFNVYFSTKKGGTGLGLPTARRIVEQHGGDIKVRSVPGSGTTFTVSLPAAKQ